MANFGHFATFSNIFVPKWSKLIQNDQFWPFCNICQHFHTKVVQIDSEWPILVILQLFQYLPTKVVQIHSEQLILAVLQLFKYFLTKVVQIDSEWPNWPFGMFSNCFHQRALKLFEIAQKYSEHIIFTFNVNFQEVSLHMDHGYCSSTITKIHRWMAKISLQFKWI